MAILINTMPDGVQDHVISQMSKDAKYDEVKEIVKRYAARKGEAHNGPSPKDVGGMSGQYDESEDCDWSEDNYEEHEESDVNGMSDAIFYNCGGKGHLSTSCPSPSKGESKGKGGKGHWGKGQFGPNGNGKGVSSKGYKGGKGGKGKGEGYQGTCSKRGQVGHKQTERTNPVPVQMADGQGDGGGQWTEPTACGSVACGSVWEAGNEETVENRWGSPNRLAAFMTTDEGEDVDEKTISCVGTWVVVLMKRTPSTPTFLPACPHQYQLLQRLPSTPTIFTSMPVPMPSR